MKPNAIRRLFSAVLLLGLLVSSAQAESDAAPSLIEKCKRVLATFSSVMDRYKDKISLAAIKAEWQKESSQLSAELSGSKAKDVNIDEIMPKSEISMDKLMKLLPDPEKMQQQSDMADDLLSGKTELNDQSLEHYQGKFYRKTDPKR